MKKQTAVEWLMEQILPTISETLSDVCIKELIEIAKALEKEQIQDAFYFGIEVDESKVHSPYKAAEDYYNQTYGS